MQQFDFLMVLGNEDKYAFFIRGHAELVYDQSFEGFNPFPHIYGMLVIIELEITSQPKYRILHIKLQLILGT